MEVNLAAARAVVLAKEQKNGVCTFSLSKLAPGRPPTKDSSPESSSTSGGSGDEPMELEPTNPLSVEPSVSTFRGK